LQALGFLNKLLQHDQVGFKVTAENGFDLGKLSRIPGDAAVFFSGTPDDGLFQGFLKKNTRVFKVRL
jgi:hypothetical protein